MNSATLLYRQAHPKFIEQGQLTSQVFMVFPKDEGYLSVYDGDLINPKDAFNHYTKILLLASDSVWAVTKAEAESAGVPASPDPKTGFPEHSKIDFGNPTEKENRKIAKRLKSFALGRGCQYKP